MTKVDAVRLFGSVKKLQKALALAPRTYYNWDEVLTQAQEDRVRGAFERYAEQRDKEVVHILGAK